PGTLRALPARDHAGEALGVERDLSHQGNHETLDCPPDAGDADAAAYRRLSRRATGGSVAGNGDPRTELAGTRHRHRAQGMGCASAAEPLPSDPPAEASTRQGPPTRTRRGAAPA